MTSDAFLTLLQAHSAEFARAVATNEGEWIIKGFIDIYRQIYTVSVDTKIVSKVLELLLFPMFVDFAKQHSLGLELCPQQNFYPDLTFVDKQTAAKFAVDIKSTYRIDDKRVNGMTLGAATRPGSGNTKNIGSVTNIADLVSGNGPFAHLGEEVYDDYWMYYLTRDMAQALGVQRPYANLKSYAEYKQRGTDIIKAHKQEIEELSEDEDPNVDQEEQEGEE